MTDEGLKFTNPLQALFDHDCKNIADLKSREWQATTLSLTGIAGLYALDRGGDTAISPWVFVLAVAFVYVAHAVIMYRCWSNFKNFKGRLEQLVADSFPSDLRDRFTVVDEGSIRTISLTLMLAAAVFVSWAILRA